MTATPNPAELVRRLHQARERWLELQPGKQVLVRRPAEAHWGALRRGGAEAFIACVVDWRGFTEADFAPGAGTQEEAPASLDGLRPEPLPFDAEAWAALALDRSDWVSLLVDRVTTDIKAHAQAAEARRKN